MKNNKEHEEVNSWLDWVYIKSANHFTYSEKQILLDEIDDLRKQLN